MNECDWCGKPSDELWAEAGEYGRTEWVCDDCAPGPVKRDVTTEKQLRCPVCGSAEYQDASGQHWFSRAGGLFHCERKHLFTMEKVAQQVRVADEACVGEPKRLDVTGRKSPLCPVCRSAKNKKVIKQCPVRHSGPLFECIHGHVFEVLTFTEGVWIPDD